MPAVQVEDSDDADAGGTNDDLGRPASGGGEPTRPSDMDVAARHINSMGQEGLSWVARQMRRQAVPAIGEPIILRCLDSHADQDNHTVLF